MIEALNPLHECRQSRVKQTRARMISLALSELSQSWSQHEHFSPLTHKHARRGVKKYNSPLQISGVSSIPAFLVVTELQTQTL